MRRKTVFIFDRDDWPRFRRDAATLAAKLGAVRPRQGRLLGQMASLGVDGALAGTLRKGRVLARAGAYALNERQLMMLTRLIDGFAGKLTSSKWAKMAKCSQDTASRDIDVLLRAGLLAKEAAGGRSTSDAVVD